MATDLLRLQQWMQACIAYQGDCEEALQSPAAASAIPAGEARTVVKPGPVLSSLERLDIYRDMYLLRMREALEIDYPALAHYLGAEDFFALVARYVESYPSRSYTLNRLGDHLPEYLATDSKLKKKEFCAELARLEYGLTQVFDEEETPQLTTEAIAAIPADAWERARLRPIAAFRLMAFNYPVSAYLAAVDEESSFPMIRKRRTWVVGYRRNFHVHRLDLTRPAYELLSLLAEGKTLGEALGTVKARQSQLFEWFRDWMAEGLFRSVDLAE